MWKLALPKQRLSLKMSNSSDVITGSGILFVQKLTCLLTFRQKSSRAVARTLMGGVFVHILMFCPTSFFSN